MSEPPTPAPADATGATSPHPDPTPPPSTRGRSLRIAVGHGLRWLLPLAASLAVIGLIALFAYGLIRAARAGTLVSEIAAGKRPAAPEFKLEPFWPPTGSQTPTVAHAIHAGALDLARLRGHAVVLNFWASWCVACRAEAGVLTSAAATNPSIAFVGVDVQDLRGDAIGFLRRYHVTYTAVSDKTNSTYENYGLTGVPETYYIDAHGRIVAHDPGAVSIQSLTAGIRKANQ